MGIPLTRKKGIKKIKSHESYRELSSGHISIAKIESLIGEDMNPTFFNEIQVDSIASYILFFIKSEDIALCLMWPNGAFLSADPNTNKRYWISPEDVYSWNERMVGY